jgi:hypothetical protein
MEDVVMVSACLPVGSFGGSLKEVNSAAIEELILFCFRRKS